MHRTVLMHALHPVVTLDCYSYAHFVLVMSCRPSTTPGAPPTALHSGGAIVDETGIMTDGAGVPTGTPLSDPPLVAAISEDPILRNTKMIAEAWDCDGLYQVLFLWWPTAAVCAVFECSP